MTPAERYRVVPARGRDGGRRWEIRDSYAPAQRSGIYYVTKREAQETADALNEPRTNASHSSPGVVPSTPTPGGEE